ncbi:hypothetical protein ACFSTC_60935 [Nonomuraea ferruginea]
MTVTWAVPTTPASSRHSSVSVRGPSTSGTSSVTSVPEALSTPTSTCVSGTVLDTRTAWRPSWVNSGSTATRTSSPRRLITGVEVSVRSACRIPS